MKARRQCCTSTPTLCMKSPLRRRFATLRERACPCGAQTKPSPPWTTPSLHESGRWRSTGPEDAATQVRTLRQNCADFDVPLFDIEGDIQGIVHVIGPELGVTQPGMTIVCGDSHTSTHGAFGALAFGIGTSEVGYVLATQCLMQDKAKTFAINVAGSLGLGSRLKTLSSPSSPRMAPPVVLAMSSNTVARRFGRSTWPAA